MLKCDPCPRQMKDGNTIIVISCVYFLSDKLSEIIMKSQINDQLTDVVEVTDFESIRPMVVQHLDSKKE